MARSSQHYTVNDDIYGKILKKPSPKKMQYDEVYEAVGGLGITFLPLRYLKYVLHFFYISCLILIIQRAMIFTRKY